MPHIGGSIRRDTKDIPQLGPIEIADICERAACPRDACMVALLYLTGRRIGEVLPLQKKDFRFDKEKKLISFKCRNEKTYHYKKGGKYTIEVIRSKRWYDKKNEQWRIVSSIWYEQIEPKFSTIGTSGAILGRFVIDYVGPMQSEVYIFAPRVATYRNHISRQQAYHVLRLLDVRLWLHALRHMNFTRMADVYAERPTDMHSLTFHKRFESTLAYINTKRAEEKLEKM